MQFVLDDLDSRPGDRALPRDAPPRRAPRRGLPWGCPDHDDGGDALGTLTTLPPVPYRGPTRLHGLTW